jgi:hypothetical protein
MNANKDTATIAFLLIGGTIDQDVRSAPAPSVFAACGGSLAAPKNRRSAEVARYVIFRHP